MEKLTNCKACEKEVAKGIKKCPHCGKDQRNFFMKHKILCVVSILVIFGIIGSLSEEDQSQNATTTANTDSKPVSEVKDTTDVLITAINHSKNSIGEDTVTLTIKNNSTKVLKNVTVGIVGYDSEGYPIKLNFGYDDVYMGKSENINLQPAASNDYTWTVYAKENNLGKAKACIDTYEFYDNNEQKNEYFSTWFSDTANKQYK